MKQEEVEKLMLKIDKKCKLPKYWDNFIKENIKAHHLIIKDKKKNSRGDNKLKELRYSADYKSLEIGGLGEQFTYLINNDGNIDDFYSSLDKYINHIKNKSNDKSDVKLQKRLKK